MFTIRFLFVAALCWKRGSQKTARVNAGDKEKPGTLLHKGHELVAISFHMPTTCEVCPKPLRHMFRAPPALECRLKSISNNFEFYFCLQLVNIKYL